MTTTEALRLKIGYDRRSAAIIIQDSNDLEAQATVYLPSFWRSAGVTLREVQAIWKQSRMPENVCDMEALLEQAVPKDCSGMVVADIGGWDGRFARLARIRGAKHALCVDSEQWREYTTWQEPERYPGVEYVKADFQTWDGEIDWALLYNVIYHVEEPRSALKHLRSITKHGLSISSITIWDDEPVWMPMRDREWIPDDPTDFWVPSDSGLVKMLQITDWHNVVQVGKAYDRLVLAATTSDEATPQPSAT